MANRVELLPAEVYVKLEAPRVAARVETPVIPAESMVREIPVLVAPGRPGPPGKDGAVIGGAVIDDTAPSTIRVWSSQHTSDQDAAVVTSLMPEVDLTLLFNNALL